MDKIDKSASATFCPDSSVQPKANPQRPRVADLACSTEAQSWRDNTTKPTKTLLVSLAYLSLPMDG